MNNYDIWLRLDNQNTDYSKEALIQYNKIEYLNMVYFIKNCIFTSI